MRSSLLVLLLLGLAWVNGSGLAPSLLWASKGVYGSISEPVVAYQTVRFVDLWKATLAAHVANNVAENTLYPVTNQAPEFFVLFVGSQASPWQLSGDPAAEPLLTTFKAAAAKFVFNDVRLEDPLMDTVSQALAAMGADVEYLGSCPEAKGGEMMSQLDTLLKAKSSGKPRVVVVCGEGDVKQELLQLQQVDTAMRASQAEYVMMFASEMQGAVPEQYMNSPQRRRTLKSDADTKLPIQYDLCDDLCRTRVKFLEGIILSLVLAMALLSGLCCMHILDTPTQYEKPEDADT